MSIERVRQLAAADNCELIRGLFLGQMLRGELGLPVPPEVAARVVAGAGSPDTDAPGLARTITGDQVLAAHVMRVATSAIYQPRQPIESLRRAISWLGVAAVSDIAFTVAVKGKLLNVPRQRARVQKMWNQAVGTAQWSRFVADAAGCQRDPSHLAGLLHEIGEPAALQAVAELSRRAATPQSDAEIDALVAGFRATVGSPLAASGSCPALCSASWSAGGPGARRPSTGMRAPSPISPTTSPNTCSRTPGRWQPTRSRPIRSRPASAGDRRRFSGCAATRSTSARWSTATGQRSPVSWRAMTRRWISLVPS